MTVSKTLGDFGIAGELGRGGSGVVYDAIWGPRRVALKVLHAELIATDKARAQFLAEAKRLQQVAHPSVVKVFAVGELPDGRPYLAMERLAGETLATALARGPMPLDRALALFGELCGAVGALHAQGLVHRDLKPENVFVVEDRHVVLLDFGIAKELAAAPSTTTQEGHVRGTPAYMAPERFFGQSASVATDVYELALVLYVMLCARLPWDEAADPEARLAPRSLSELVSLPAAVDVEIRRALSTRAPNRPASAEALLAAVRGASGSAAAPEPAVTARMRPSDEPQRSPGPPVGEQATPLAWAPTVPATTGKRARRRWVWAPAIAVVAAGGAIAWRLSAGRDAPAPARAPAPAPAVAPVAVASGHDPWAERHEAPAEVPAKALALVEPRLSRETYRAEAAAAIARLPADTRFAFTAQIGEMRAQPQLADMLDKAGKDPRIALLAGSLPPCVRAVVVDSEWIAFGAPSLDTTEDGTLVLRGRWRRADVESCFGDTVKPHVAHDGAKLFRIGDDFWLDFIDEHTAYVTKHAERDAEAVHAIVRHGAGPGPRARELVAKLPADRTIAFVHDGRKGDRALARGLAVPDDTDLYGWLRADPDGVTLDIAADPHDGKAAQSAADRLRPQLDELAAKAPSAAIGKLDVVRDKTVVHLRGNMTALMLSLVGAAL